MFEKFKDMHITKSNGLIQVYSQKGTRRDISNRYCSAFLYATTGKITYYHQGQQFVCDKHHILFVPKDITYYLECSEEDISYVFNFEVDIAFDTFVSLEIVNDNILKLFDRFYLSNSKDDEQYETQSCAFFYSLLNNLLFNQFKHSYPLIVMDAIKYIESNISESSLNNEMIAKSCFVSIIYLQKLFAKYVGKGIRAYILNKRILKAEQLLTTTDIPIHEIAELSGFASDIHFSRTFTKHHSGVTPLLFRKNNSL